MQRATTSFLHHCSTPRELHEHHGKTQLLHHCLLLQSQLLLQ